MSEWKEYELSELIDEIAMGPFGSNIKVECFTDTGVPVLNGSNLIGFRLNEDSFNYVTEEKANSLGRANAYRGDIVITHRGTLGQIVYIPQNSKYERYVISQSQFRVRCNEKVLPEYLVYFFHSRLGQFKLLSNASQVGVPSLARPSTTFQKLTVELPPLEKQREIVKVLSSLDDKIELNNQINDNLEKQAQALFKNWFIDYVPFGGQMPSDWRMYKLSELADFISGYSYKGSELVESNIGMATIKNFERNGGFKLEGYKDILPSDKIKDCQFVDMFDILVSHTDLTQNAEVIGNAELILSKGKYDRLIMSMDLVKVVAKDNVSPFLIAALLRTENFKKHCLGYVNGTTVLHMSKKALPDYEIAMPENLTVLNSFTKVNESIIRQMSNNIEENQRLITLRDTLLPKFMSDEA